LRAAERECRRVLSTEPIEVEVTFEAAGKVPGVDYSELGTCDGRRDHLEGRGVGVFKERGAVSYRGAIFLQTTAAKFASLNTVAGVFEFEVDETGNAGSKIREWK
jgi:hypothetical protein